MSDASHSVKRLRVGVVYGGRSGEHEVSLASAASVWANLDRRRYEPVAIRIEKDGRWVLADRPPAVASAAEVIEQSRSDARVRGGREVFLPPRPGGETLVIVDRGSARGEGADSAATLTGLALDVLFPVLHGPFGEDGTIQGLFELANIAYVGCGVLASSVGMDKAVMKVLFQARGLKVSDWVTVSRRDWRTSPDKIIKSIEAKLAYPIFVKPANLGSSVGISKVKVRAELAPALDLAAGFDEKVVVEAAVPDAREIECAVLGNDAPEASMPGEIIPSREFYDYEAKYIDDQSKVEIPAKLNDALVREVRAQAITAFQAIDGSGLGRVDFLLSRSTGELFINEINSMPGFTTISMYPKMWEATGLAYPQLLDRLIQLAIERHGEKQRLRTSVTDEHR
jgi:D-alanine-D-alanine ligase